MQHYTVYLFLENRSTFFGWYLHPSSGAHTNVFTVSSTCQPLLLPAAIAAGSSNGCQVPDTVNTVVCAPNDGWRYHPKNVELFSRNK